MGICDSSNDLNNNSSALIWAGKDSTYNITNNLINTSATIYSVNNLTLQKSSSTDSSLNKMTSLQNISGTIQAQKGEIYIKATSLENKRDADDYRIISTATDSSNNEYEAIQEHSAYGWVGSGWNGWTLVRFNVPELPYKARYNYLVIDRSLRSYIEKSIVTRRAEDPTNSFSKISAGTNIFINSTNFTNEASQILAGANITIDTTNFSNNSVAISDTVKHKCMAICGYCRVYDSGNLSWDPNYWGVEISSLGFGSSLRFEVESSSMAASIKAGGSLRITQNGTPKSDWTSGDTNIVEGASTTSTSKLTKDSSFSGINPITLLTTGEIDIDLSSILSVLGVISTDDSSSSEVSGSSFSTTAVTKTTHTASSASGSGSGVDTSASTVSIADSDSSTSNTTINSGLFKIHKDTNPNKPLIESRSQFTSLGEFYGSDYFYEQLGISKQLFLDAERASINASKEADNKATVRMLGDSFVENKLVTQQLEQIRKDALLLSDNETNTNAEIKRLIDNAVSEKSRLNLDITKGLSTDQVNSLDKDIIWFEGTNINGQFVIVPKIYLSLATRNSLLGTSATVDDLSSASSLASITSNINSTSLGNSSLTTGSTIFSKGSLTINSPTANLTNSGSIISRAGDVNINVGSISSVSNSFANASIKALTISTDSSGLTSGGNINLTANSGNILLQNSILNSQSKLSVTSLSSSGNISIINNSSLKLSSLPTSLSSSSFSTLGTKDDAATTRSSATFNAGTDIEITSSGNINIANNYLNTGGSIYMTAAKDINNSNYIIKASDNVVMDAVNINNISTATSANKDTLSETRIEADNMVSLNAAKDTDGNGGNITNIGATINAGSLLYLTAENNITNKALIEYNINGNLTYSSGLSSSQTSTDFNNSTSNPTLDSTGTSTADTNLLSSNANYIRSNLVNQGTLSSGGNLVLVAGNNLNNIGSNITSTGASYLEATAGDINITTAALRDRTVTSWGSKKKGGTSTEDRTTNIQSSITSGADLDLVSGNDTTLQAAKLSATDNINITTGNNLLLLTAQDSYFKLVETKSKGIFAFNNTTSLRMSTKVINNEISQGGDLNINKGNVTYAEYKNGSMDSTDAKLAYLKNLDASSTIYKPIDEISKATDTTTRGLTQTGTIVIALAASLATGGVGMVGAMAGTAAATASVSATNASMNDDGNFFRSLDDVGKTSLKDTTSKESLKSIAVAGVTAGIIQGIGELAKAKDVAGVASAANTANNVGTAANTANNITNAANTTANIASAANTANTTAQTLERVITNLGNATAKVAISTTAYTIANSAINGESLTASLKQQNEKLLLAQILGEAGAKEIGLAYHNNKISQPTQLALHGALGCAISSGVGGGCASGAAAGIAAEYIADKAYNNGTKAENAILIGQATGAAAALLTSAIQNKDDEQIAKNTSFGSFVGANAVINNALQIKAQKVAANKNHLTVVHTPEPNEQVNYAGKEGYVQDKESGLWIRTWGAGTDNWKENLLNGNQLELTSNNNRERDQNLSIKNYTSPNLVPINQEKYYVQLLNNLDHNYQDNLRYDIFPNLSSSSGYNSNSYVSGLLIAADILPPSIPDIKQRYQWQAWEYDNSKSINIEYKFPLQVPGYDKPVPSQYFKSN